MGKLLLNNTKVADFGFVGENGVTDVCFDLSEWKTELGSGTAKMFLILPGGSTATEVTVTTADDIASHTLTSTEMATAGEARLQVVYEVAGTRAKSRIWDAVIHESLEVSDDETDNES